MVFAANHINHAVLLVRHRAASLLLRRMHPSLLGKEWCAKNIVVVNQKMCGGEHVEQTAKRFKASDEDSTNDGSTCSGCSPVSFSGGRTPLDLGNGPVVVNGVDHNRKLWEFHHNRRASIVQVNPRLDSPGGDEQVRIELSGEDVDLDMRAEK